MSVSESVSGYYHMLPPIYAHTRKSKETASINSQRVRAIWARLLNRHADSACGEKITDYLIVCLQRTVSFCVCECARCVSVLFVFAWKQTGNRVRKSSNFSRVFCVFVSLSTEMTDICIYITVNNPPISHPYTHSRLLIYSNYSLFRTLSFYPTVHSFSLTLYHLPWPVLFFARRRNQPSQAQPYESSILCTRNQSIILFGGLDWLIHNEAVI